MNRKKFIGSILGTAAALNTGALTNKNNDKVFYEEDHVFKIPPYLKPGDVVGITSPAGYITNEEIQPAVKKLEEWGFRVKTGSTIGKREFTFGGTDEERRADMQDMLDDRNVKAIMCARGGYGSVRIIDNLDYKKFAQHPKWIIGFSDVTVIHSHIHKNLNIATIHSKMCNSFPSDWNLAEQSQKDTIESIRHCLVGNKMKYESGYSLHNRTGSGTGQLIGGNLKTLETLTGSKSDIDTANKILFVEDTGEYLYSLDRMFWTLKRTGKLSLLKGLIIGGFKVKKDDEGEEFGMSLEKIVQEKIKEYKYPVCFDFPVGHQRNNYALKCGCIHTLSVSENKTLLSEK